MSYKYLKSIYNAINNNKVCHVIVQNEFLLNSLTQHLLLGGAPPFDRPINQMKAEVEVAINELLQRCGSGADTDKIVRLIRALIRYIDILYGTVKDVDLLTVRAQLEELNVILKSL